MSYIHSKHIQFCMPVQFFTVDILTFWTINMFPTYVDPKEKFTSDFNNSNILFFIEK